MICDGLHFTRIKHFHDRIISLKGQVLACKTSLTSPSLFIEVPVPSHDMRGHVFVGVSILPLFLRFFYNILEMFRWSAIIRFIS